MAKKGKKYSDSVKLFEKSRQYDTAEAMGLVCKTAKAKFDETVEIHVRLGVDSRHADQQVRGAVVLPNGTGKTVRTLVFTKGDKVQAALDAGAGEDIEGVGMDHGKGPGAQGAGQGQGGERPLAGSGGSLHGRYTSCGDGYPDSSGFAGILFLRDQEIYSL